MKLTEKFPNWGTNSYFFNDIKTFLNADVDGVVLSNMYFGGHSALKDCSKIFDMLYPNVDDYHGDDMIAMYGLSWKRIYEAIKEDYNPLDNYNMVESETESGENEGITTGVSSTNNSSTRDISEKNEKSGLTTDNLSSDSTTNKSDSKEEENKTSAYNTSEYQPDGLRTESGSEKSTSTGTDNRTINDSNTEDTTAKDTLTAEEQVSENTTNSVTHKTDRRLTRSGNIGVTTSQQMLQSELELREYNFWEKVFRDIDKTIAVLVY